MVSLTKTLKKYFKKLLKEKMFNFLGNALTRTIINSQKRFSFTPIEIFRDMKI